MHSPVATLLAQRGGGYFSELPSGKLLCSLNGHEVSSQVDAVESFMSGAKYLRLKAAADAKKALAKYEPFLVQSRNFDDKLYCSLTCQLLGKSVMAVRQHMRGKKFQRAKVKFEADETDLVEEPPLDTEAQKPESMDEGNTAESVELVGVAAPANTANTSAEEELDLWIPDEYVNMESEAAAEALAERRTKPSQEVDTPETSGRQSAEVEAVDRRRPKPGKKQKTKRRRVS